MGEPGGRLPWIDFIRAGGAFLVVLAHVILYPSLKGSGPVWAQTLYYTVSRIAVPLFFMISGYLLLGKSEGYEPFLRKRALRVFVPFVIWSVLYLWWNGGFDGKALNFETFGEALLRILRGPRASHLWFFYVIISLYLFTPILRVFTLNAQARDLYYFCGLWFFLDPVLALIRRETGVLIGFEFLFVTGYIGYFVLGYTLGRLKLARRVLLVAVIVFFASLAFVFATIYLGEQQPGYDQFFEGYLSLPVVLMTASAFLLIRALDGPAAHRAARWILPFSSASLGIYLAHVMVLDLIDSWIGSGIGALQGASSIWAMPVVALVAFAACYLLVALLKRIPWARYAVP